MAAQTILVLIDRRIHFGNSITSAHTRNAVLGSPGDRRDWKRHHLSGRMSTVAIRAGGMAVAVQHIGLSRVVDAGSRRKWVAHFRIGKLCKDIRSGGRHVCPSAVAGDTVLFIGLAQQPASAKRIVWSVTGDARILRYRRITSYIG